MSTEAGTIPLELVQRAFKWLNGRDTVMSSEAILSHMMSGTSSGSYPLDPADLGRCLRLLGLFPEWKPRIGEMAGYGKTWAMFAERWDELSKAMADEVGIDWSKGREARQTYDLMKSLRAQSGER